MNLTRAGTRKRRQIFEAISRTIVLVLALISVACGPIRAGVEPLLPSSGSSPTPLQDSGDLALRSISEIATAQPGDEEIILATTTSTQDSGLLDVLVPMFERRTRYRVKTIAVGTGQALALGARGEADVLLVHAPEAERAWMADGNGAERLVVMHNDFVVVGPSADPARANGHPSAEGAFQSIARAAAPFISRGDQSGTHVKELDIWRGAQVDPRGQAWYLEVGQGMGATLNIADERDAYTLTDRATYLARRDRLRLQIQVEGQASLLNVYHVMPVNGRKFQRINAAGANAFARFMVARETQQIIARFGVAEYGQPLFFADAARPVEALGEPSFE